jgi:hypothetical protein
MDELVLVPQNGAAMGYVIFMKDELVALMATERSMCIYVWSQGMD